MDASNLKADNADGGDNAGYYREMMHGTAGKEQEFDAYARALYHLEKAGAVSEFHKPAEHLQEFDLMREAGQIATRRSFGGFYNEGQYERIFDHDQNSRTSAL